MTAEIGNGSTLHFHSISTAHQLTYVMLSALQLLAAALTTSVSV